MQSDLDSLSAPAARREHMRESRQFSHRETILRLRGTGLPEAPDPYNVVTRTRHTEDQARIFIKVGIVLRCDFTA